VGDVLLLFTESYSVDPAVVAPAGWTQLTFSPQATPTSTDGTRVAVFWRRADGTESSPLTVANPGDHTYSVTMAVRGCRAATVFEDNPFDDMMGGFDDATSNLVTFSSGLITEGNNRLIVFVVARGNDLADSEFTPWTNAGLFDLHDDWTDSGTLTGNGGGLAATAGTKVYPGDVGVTTAVISQSVRKAWFQLALAPVDPPVAQSLVRERAYGASQVVWTANVFLSTTEVDGYALAVHDIGDRTKQILSVDDFGNMALTGNLAASGGSTIASSNFTWGAASKLDASDIIELGASVSYLTPVRVQVKKTSVTGSASLTAAAWSPATTAGNLLLMAIHYTLTGSPSVPPSGWTEGKTSTGATGKLLLYYKVAAGADAAPAVTAPGSCDIIIITSEYTNLATFDAAQSRSGSSATPTFNSGDALSTQTDEQWFGVVGSMAGGTQSLPTDGFAIVDQLVIGGSQQSLALLDKHMTVTALIKGGDTTAASADWAAVGVTFKSTGGATIGTPATGKVRVYTKKPGSESLLLYKSDAGTEYSLQTLQLRSLFIPAGDLKLDSATTGTLGTTPNLTSIVAYADAATQGAYTNLVMPLDAVTATIKVRPIWVPGSTDGVAHTVRWSMNIKILTAADVTAAGTTVTWTGDSATRTANVQVVEAGQLSTAVTPAAGEDVRLLLQRIGADGADTYVGIVNLLGIRIDYTSRI
jgi:hypothetical protein